MEMYPYTILGMVDRRRTNPDVDRIHIQWLRDIHLPVPKRRSTIELRSWQPQFGALDPHGINPQQPGILHQK